VGDTVKSSEFSVRVGEIVEDANAGLDDIAGTMTYVLLVDRLTDEPGELGPDAAIEDAMAEFEMELTIAFADSLSKVPPEEVAHRVDAFMATHVKPFADSIISDVASNLMDRIVARSVPGGPRSKPAVPRTDNDR
jgi:hypothetical protein